MAERERRPMPLFLKLMCWIMAFLMVLMVLAMVVTMNYTVRIFWGKIDSVLQSTVQTLSQMPQVRQALLEGRCSVELTQFIDSVVQNTEDMDYITIADTDCIRIYHVDPAFVGLPFDGEDQYRALQGEAYISDANPQNFEDQHRAFHPIRDADGTILGFAMAAATHIRLKELQIHIYVTYIRMFLVLGIISLVFCSILAVYLGKNLRGIRPEDLLRVYLTQNDILNSLDEGLVSFDRRGRVRLVNAAAARMLGQREDLLVGRNVDELLRSEEGESLRDRRPGGLQSDHSNILVQVVQLPNSNLWARQVLILVDKSEAIRQAEILGGTQHLINALRANTHEFLNKLQVISGLLQMGYVREAVDYIGDIAIHHEQGVGPVLKLIRNASLAGLIQGKMGNMRELDIAFTLMNNSHLPEESRYLEGSELVTVVGNLLENAIEAVNGVPSGNLRAISLQITEDARSLFIMVSDTGEGISPENLPHIFKTGFSTKANQGRGLGMKLIKDIVDRHGGSIDVDTEPGSGTNITAIFQRERGAQL